MGRTATPARAGEFAGPGMVPAAGRGRLAVFRFGSAGRLRQDGHLAREAGRERNMESGERRPRDEYEPLPSPNGKRMIVMASDGLYMTKLENGRWTPKTRLGPDVNVNGTE